MGVSSPGWVLYVAKRTAVCTVMHRVWRLYFARAVAASTGNGRGTDAHTAPPVAGCRLSVRGCISIAHPTMPTSTATSGT